MKNKTKMNILYKIAFIIMLVCIVLLVTGAVTGYLIDPVFALIFAGSGVALAFVAIVFASLSSPKKEKTVDEENIVEQPVDK